MKQIIKKPLRALTLIAAVSALTSCASVTPNLYSGAEKGGRNDFTKDVFQISENAEKAYRESRWSDAARQYQRLTEQVPGDAYIWFRLANTYAQKGDFGQAIHAYEKS